MVLREVHIVVFLKQDQNLDRTKYRDIVLCYMFSVIDVSLVVY